MHKEKILFWNVDTQVDFIDPHGKLYVADAGKLKPMWAKITRFAAENQIRVVNTCDFHQINAEEISPSPDYITTFPAHCIAGTPGSAFIKETMPASPVTIDWDTQLAIFAEFDDPVRYRNIVIRKDDFDVFAGNPHTSKILNIINPDKIFVYGVTTNVCVDRAVRGLIERGFQTFVIKDAIKELPQIPLPYDQWQELGVHMVAFEEVERMVESANQP